MPAINKVSAAVFDRPARPRGRQPSPDQLEMMERIRSLKTPRDAFEVLLIGEEKATTVRAQIARAAKAVDVDIAVLRSPHGWYVGLMTPERQRGRRRAASAS